MSFALSSNADSIDNVFGVSCPSVATGLKQNTRENIRFDTRKPVTAVNVYRSRYSSVGFYKTPLTKKSVSIMYMYLLYTYTFGRLSNKTCDDRACVNYSWTVIFHVLLSDAVRVYNNIFFVKPDIIKKKKIVRVTSTRR